jgi:hypothetical protein
VTRPNHPTLVPAAVAALALVTAGPMASADEVTVQNDSATDGSTVAIQAGFIAGESASAWLTSPCDGEIVAVQVLWLSLTGGAPQSVEDSITISAGGTFPIPGPELEFLEAPVMTDGFLNEFRFLDKAQTVPLSVPVSIGEEFVVSFRFFNSPSPIFGPSVCTDINGCQFGKNGLFAIPGGWLNLCSFGASGDFIIRAVVECGDVPGPCCLNDGACVLLLDDDCAAAGGGCIDLETDDCFFAGGFSQGAGTVCDTIECFAAGACCQPDGSCDDAVSPQDCASGGGVFQGVDSACSGVTCPQPQGGCCFSTGFCLELEEVECNMANGTWAGPFTDCTDADMSGTADVCETDCPADLDGNEAVDFQDLLLMLASWSPNPGSCPGCPADVDGDDDVDFQDLLVMLAAWGPCGG